jgi:hypothetical protein
LFRLIFGEEKNKGNLLDLYNAINNTEYDDVSQLHIMTIDDCIYMGMKNDISLLIDFWLSLYEQQSTWNPNIPVRGLFYFADMFEKYIALNKLNIYGSKLVKLPTPQYIVFYNGIDERMGGKDEVKLKLSDAFGDNSVSSEFEWTATVKNIIEDAVNKAVDECIKEGILAEFLIGHKAEVMDVCLTEYDEAATMNAFKEEAADEREDLIMLLYRFLQENNRLDEWNRSLYDKSLRKKLISEIPKDYS